MNDHRMNPAQRRYLWRFFPLMGLYMVLLFAAQGLIATWHPGGSLLVTLALLPAIPLVGVIVVLGLYLSEETDEFIRHRHVVAMLIGLGALLAVATIWGFLQVAGAADAPPVFLAFPFWCVFYGLGQGVQTVADRLAVQS